MSNYWFHLWSQLIKSSFWCQFHVTSSALLKEFWRGFSDMLFPRKSFHFTQQNIIANTVLYFTMRIRHGHDVYKGRWNALPAAPGCIGPYPRIGPASKLFPSWALQSAKIRKVRKWNYFLWGKYLLCLFVFIKLERKVGRDWPAGHRVQCPLSLEDPLRMFTGNAMQHIICNATYYLQCNVLYVYRECNAT